MTGRPASSATNSMTPALGKPAKSLSELTVEMVAVLHRVVHAMSSCGNNCCCGHCVSPSCLGLQQYLPTDRRVLASAAGLILVAERWLASHCSSS